MTKEIEKLLGPKLLTKAGAPAVPTSSALVLGSADIILLYFSASWCPPCRSFTLLLVDFYEKNGKKNGIQVVFVSSDSDLNQFNDYYEKMPWLSLPTDAETAKTKQNLSQMFHVQGIPSLVVIDGKTGKFITDDARSEVMGAGSDDLKQKEVVASWKSKEAVPIEEAVFANRGPTGIAAIITFFLRNPMYIFGILYFVRKIMSKLAEIGRDEEEQGTGEL